MSQVLSNKQSLAQRLFLNASTLFIVLLWSIPTLGLFISSFRPKNDISRTGWWTVFNKLFSPDTWTFLNYSNVINSDNMGMAFANSILVAIPSTIIPITIAAIAAYTLAWMKFKGRHLLFILIVGMMVVPLQMSLLPLFSLYNDLRLNGTFLGIWLAHTGFGLPTATYLLYNSISSLPSELIESTQIDGASPMQTFTAMVLPLSLPAIAAFAIFQFLWVWNDLLVALIFLGTKQDLALVTTRLAEMVGSRGQDWHVLTSGAFIAMIVPLIVFFTLQRYFVRGLIAGSVKG